MRRINHWAKDNVQSVRFMRLLRNGLAVFRITKGAKSQIKSLDFWDGTRLGVRDCASAAHIFEDIFLRKCYDFPEVQTARQIVDVGANIGLFSYFARRQNPKAQIIAVEADPYTAQILKSNFAGKDIQTVHCAMSDQCGSVSFYSSNVAGWSSLYKCRGAEDGEPVIVPAMKLSSLLRDQGIDFSRSTLKEQNIRSC